MKLIWLLLLSLCSCAQTNTQATQPPFSSVPGHWATQTLNQLTLEQKIGQLFMVTVIIDQGANAALVAQKETIYRTDLEYAEQLIKEHHVGGVIFLGESNPAQQMQVTQDLQHTSSVPLLIGQDCEGTGIHVTHILKFPHNMALGALTDNTLVYEVGKQVAYQHKQVGVNILFAPVVDVNNNPNNPIINDRSFGSDKENVAQKGIAYMRGLHDAGILSCAKHFPGHGDTTVDSHENLPYIKHSLTRMHDIELYPFCKLIEAGVSSVMMAHLAIPALESKRDTPASVSQTIITNILKGQFGFDGLCITDALDMQGILINRNPGEIELHAIMAGNDILLCPTNVPKAISLIKQAIQDGIISEEDINKKVHKILLAKEWALHNASHNRTQEELDLHSPIAQKIKKQIYEQAVTIAQQKSNALPLKSSQCVAHVRISTSDVCTEFEKTAQLTGERFHLSRNATDTEQTILLNKLTHQNTIVVTLHDMQRSPRINFGITDETIQLIKKLHAAHKNTMVILFGNAYSVRFFKEYADTILVAYDEEPEAQEAAARVLTGSLKATGTMPI